MAREYTVVGAEIYTPLTRIRRGYVAVSHGRVLRVGSGDPPRAWGEEINGEDLIVAPGYIDTHIHGLRGIDVSAAEPGEIAELGHRLLEHGVTGFLPTLPPMPRGEMLAACRRIAEAVEEAERSGAARVLGVSLEGPYVNPEIHGALPLEHIRRPSREEVDEAITASHGLLRQVTVAPEIPGGIEIISYLVSRGVVVSIGHTMASYHVAMEAVAAGASKATHFFNAMRGFHHRDPGVVLALLEAPGVYLEVIPDNHHVAPEAIRFLYKAAGPGRIVAVSDAVAPAKQPPGRYMVWGEEIVIGDDGTARIPATGRLAGSTIALDDAARNLHAAGLPLNHVFASLTRIPALSIGEPPLCAGVLRPGCRGDMVLLDKSLRVRIVFAGGEPMYTNG